MKSMLPPFDLDRFLDQLNHRLGLVGDVTIHHPAETAELVAIPQAELDSAAARHDMRVVRRMGGTQFEFTRRSVSDFPYQTLKFPF